MQPPPKQPNSRPPELISVAELARKRGVHKSTAWRACKGSLRAAVVDRYVDASHPLVRKWLAQVEATTMVDEPDSVPPPPTKGEGPVPTREDFARLQFRKRLAETLKLELANRERLGHLIEREFVQQHLLALLEGQNIRLLRDLPQTGAARLFALARSSHGTVEEGAKFLRDAISDALTRTRNEAVRNLRQKRKKESDDANRSEAER